MLGTPKAGWSKITVDNRVLGSASYIDWIPGIVLEACINYLKAAKTDFERWDYSDGRYGFNLEFDGEGAGDFGIVEIGKYFYTYDTFGEEAPYIRLKEIDLEPFTWLGYRFVRHLTEEVLDDIKKDFEAWTLWDAVDEEDVEKNTEALNDLIKKAEKALEELKEAEKRRFP